ncbi:MAG: Beta-glucosidase, partial [Acidimicrobiaceae bacterium]|nr:Beta-glucosidase [Acidimicrobiaceae bacterium]
MTLSEKLAFVVLVPRDGYENSNAGVPRLCIRPLTLQDGPNGIAYDARGVTQLPSSLALAASFDTSLAYDYGRVLGSEARGKGIDAVQGPNLNLLRVPTSGRAFEGYGEDPYLVGQMGVADIQGIQSEHVMADAKHYTAYNQETARVLLNQVVSQRALYELYLAPFAAAVEQGHVASIMCAYGSLNGVNTCSDPKLYSILQSWGFKGFVRSDLGAVLYSGPAFRAGMDLIKPASESTLRQLVDRHVITIGRLDDAVRRTLGEMFAFGLVAHPLRGTMATKVDSAAHADFAVTAAERSMVLLKDRRGILPLSRSVTSIAVIGTSGGRSPTSVGYGSARVVPAYVASPLGAIRRSLPRRARVTYVPGGPSVHLLPSIPSTAFVAGSALPPMPRPDRPVEPGKGDLGVLRTPGVTRAVATASRPGSGGDWSSWRATIV